MNTHNTYFMNTHNIYMLWVFIRRFLYMLWAFIRGTSYENMQQILEAPLMNTHTYIFMNTHIIYNTCICCGYSLEVFLIYDVGIH